MTKGPQNNSVALFVYIFEARKTSHGIAMESSVCNKKLLQKPKTSKNRENTNYNLFKKSVESFAETLNGRLTIFCQYEILVERNKSTCFRREIVKS